MKVLQSDIVDTVKDAMLKACINQNFAIRVMETDLDHIHMLVEFDTNTALTNIVARLKQYSTYYAWKYHKHKLKSYYWKGHYLWTKGYFVTSVGEAGEKTLTHYIENQG